MDIQPLGILKWIGVVLAAGFVGYFGRYLAIMVLGQTHRKPTPVQPERAGEAQCKLAKKRAKQAVKLAKKTANKSPSFS